MALTPRITRNLYDAAGQLLQVQRAVCTPLQQNEATYSYSLNGQRASVTDANGNRAELRSDGFATAPESPSRTASMSAAIMPRAASAPRSARTAARRWRRSAATAPCQARRGLAGGGDHHLTNLLHWMYR